MTKEKIGVMSTEVMEMLRYCTKEEYEKIPQKLITVLSENKIDGYNVDIDLNKQIDEQNVSWEAKILMFIIWRKYWTSEEEAKDFDKILNENQKEFEKKYDPENIFYKNNNDYDKKDNQMIEYKESIFTKVINWVKNIFR